MDYVAPTSVKEASAILRRAGRGACIVAGGTDVLPRVASGKMRRPKQLVSLSQIPGLDKIRVEAGGHLRIGARVTLAEVARSRPIARRLPSLAEAARCIGSEQVRSTATLVGNLCSASSAADTIPPLLCADAVVEVAFGNRRRRLPLDKLIKGPRKLSIGPDALVLGVLIARQGPIGTVYRRHGPRAAMDCAVVIAAAQVTRGKKGQMVKPRLALGAVHPVPIRCVAAEGVLAGKTPDDAVLAQAAEMAAAGIKPQSDVRGSAEHRRAVIRRIVPEVVLEALARARGVRG